MCHCKNVRREKEQCACKRLFGFTYVSGCVFCNLSAVPHIYVVRFRGDDKKTEPIRMLGMLRITFVFTRGNM